MLSLMNQCQGSITPFIRSAVVDEQRMMPSHWLGLVLSIFFLALTLMIVWQEGHSASENRNQ